MKRFILLGIACITTLIFTGCANRSGSNTQIQSSLVNEYWMQHINLDPNKWTRHASNWFFTNEPSQFDQFANTSPLSNAITVMTVRVPNFTKIRVDGPFQVQVVGRQEHSSVYILGPNSLARHTVTESHGNTLFIHPDTECTSKCGNLEQVIIRVGVRELNSVNYNGNGYLEGKDIESGCMDVSSTGSGNVLLVGNMVLREVSQKGSGTISILGANTPGLNVSVQSNGNLNLSGRINVRRIQKAGNGMLNIIGSSSDGLMIKSTGGGVTTLVGYTNLRKVSAEDSSRVYVYWVNSSGIYVDVHDHAHVGLAGATGNLDVDADGSSIFQGKYLRADNAYVKTRTNAHANVTPSNKLFASAMDNSSIYFFGAPNIVSRYVLGNAAIIPIFSESCPVPEAPRPPASSYKGEGGFSAPVTSGYKADGGFTPVASNISSRPKEGDSYPQFANNDTNPTADVMPTNNLTAVAENKNSAGIPANAPIVAEATNTTKQPDHAPAVIATNEKHPTKATEPTAEVAANENKTPDSHLAAIAANNPKPKPDNAPVVVASDNNKSMLDNMLSAIATSVSKSRPAPAVKAPTELAANDSKKPVADAPQAVATNKSAVVASAATKPTVVASNTQAKGHIVADPESANGEYTIVTANNNVGHTNFSGGGAIAKG